MLGKIGAALTTAIGTLLAVGLAFAHPLGNFTVNRYARLEPTPDAFRLVYVLDLAEIPTFQELSRFPSLDPALGAAALGRVPDAERLARELGARFAAGLRVSVGATPLNLVERSRVLTFANGVGDLPTMKLELRLEAPWPSRGASSVVYEDLNEPDRLGWREIVLSPGDGIDVSGASAPFVDRSRALTQYPVGPGAVFPQERRAEFRVAGAETGGASAHGDDVSAAIRAGSRPRESDRLADLVAQGELTPTLVLISLVIAFALGGFHALSPGHGKTIVAAYLVGARGTARHALILSAIVTASHTIGVFALGFVTLALSERVVPERLYPWMQLLSGALIVAIGLTMSLRRLGIGGAHAHGHDYGGSGEHHHDHEHHAHDHSHHEHHHPLPAGEPTMADLFTLGVSGGILPCPSALVVLLSAIALHRIGFGLVLIVAFSLGLASVLCGIGILVVRAGAWLGRFDATSGLARRAPAVSAILVTVMGVLLMVRAVTDFRAPSQMPPAISAAAP